MGPREFEGVPAVFALNGLDADGFQDIPHELEVERVVLDDHYDLGHRLLFPKNAFKSLLQPRPGPRAKPQGAVEGVGKGT